VSIHQQIADRCLASAKKELASKSGEEFDKCYIGMAIASHQKAIDSDQVLQTHSSQQLKADIQEGIQMATQHLEMAKGIMKKLDGGSERTARNPADPATPRRPE
jgi:predicted outer membrane protein